MRYTSGLPLLAAVLLAGCVSPRSAERPVSAESRPAIQSYTRHGLEGVLGQNARTLSALFGQADLDIREGPARKLQFAGPACILDTYLYPPRSGGEPLVSHIDARLPDGRDMDRASCVAALRAQRQTR